MRHFVKNVLMINVSLLLHIYLYFFLVNNPWYTYLSNRSKIYAEENITPTDNYLIQWKIRTPTVNVIRNRHVPNLIIQYGMGGTATTLQFQILCVLMAITHESEIDSVGCNFGGKPAHKYTVIKTHALRDSMLKSFQSDTWIFLTSSNGLSQEARSKIEFNKHLIKKRNIRIPYIADIDMVSKRGHFIVYEYQQIFGISDKSMQQVLDYLRYWDILRQCCGKQMSADWRNHLSPRKTFMPHHNKHSATYPACEMYDISITEQLLIKTQIVQRFAYISALHEVIGKPSIGDGDLDGNYCAICNNNISIKHLMYNEPCV